ncbi:MAG: class I SAM-dependent methyltransferase [Candidatus Taylorbacteria bacterium]
MYPSNIFYTKYANSYEKYSLNKEVYLTAVDEFVIKSLSSKRPPKTMIDIGSGNGKRGKRIADILKVEKLTNVDSSKGMIKLANRILGTEVILADISDDSLKLTGKYEVLISLSNVLSHVPTEDNRILALVNISKLMTENSLLFIDVNNRYNILNYGFKSVIRNVFKDIFLPNKANGDFNLHLQIRDDLINTVVHIFNPFEIEKLFKLSGLKILERKIINYKNGKENRSIFGGQLVYKLSKS